MWSVILCLWRRRFVADATMRSQSSLLGSWRSTSPVTIDVGTLLPTPFTGQPKVCALATDAQS